MRISDWRSDVCASDPPIWSDRRCDGGAGALHRPAAPARRTTGGPLFGTQGGRSAGRARNRPVGDRCRRPLTPQGLFRRAPFAHSAPMLEFARSNSRFIGENARWLAGGFLLTMFSSFGQTFFIGLSGNAIRSAFHLSGGAFGGLYMLTTLATLASAMTLPWLGRTLDIGRA